MAKPHHNPDDDAGKEAPRTLPPADRRALPTGPAMIEAAWVHTQAQIPLDLEATARTFKALQRKRMIRSAGDLLRLILAYSLCDWSLRLVGAWATILGFASVSDVDLLKRLRQAGPWLQHLLGEWLALRRLSGPSAPALPDFCVQLCDGSSVSRPGSAGTDWRLHLRFDLQPARLAEVHLTNVHGGESLRNFQFAPGVLVIGDRAYARRAAVGEVLAVGAHVLVRMTGGNTPLERAPGQAFHLLPWLRRNARREHPVEIALWLRTATGRFAVRVIAQRLPQAAQQRAQRRVRRRAQRRQQRTPGAAGLEMTRYLVVLTSLPQTTWTAETVLELYRLRWQIELLIKRLKSLVRLDALRAFDAPLAQTYLLGKLLAAACLEEWPAQDATTAEWLAAWSQAGERPVSLWRLTQLGLEVLRQAICGSLTWARCAAAWPHLRRYLCEASRKRLQQLSEARRWLRAWGVALPPPVALPLS